MQDTRFKRSTFKEPIFWMLFTGPIAVIVFCAVAMWFAYKTPDEVISRPPGISSNAAGERAPPSMTPARAARNHAATLLPEERK